MKIYPAIDLLEGRCVRLRQGSFAEPTIYSDDPLATARGFEEAGASCLHVVDLSGARNPAQRQLSILARLARATKLKIQAGGGLRTVEDGRALLEQGVDRVVYGSAAIEDPALGLRLLSELGTERVTLAVDVRLEGERARLALKGWTEESSRSLDSVLGELAGAGLERALCTDIGRDGMMTGPNLELYARLQRAYPSVEVQASGGMSKLEDVRALVKAGVRSVVIGKALYEGAIDLREALGLC